MSKKPTFLEVIDSAVLGGAEVHTRLLSKALLKGGHRVILASPPGEYFERFRGLESLGARVLDIDIRRDFWRGVAELRAVAVREGVQVIHSHKHRADFAAALAARDLSGTARISTIHNLLRYDVANPLRRWAYYWPARWALGRMDVVFAVCEFAADHVAGYFRLESDRVVNIKNGIDVEELEESARSESLGAPAGASGKDGDVTIACVGRISPRKGQDILLDSFKPLSERFRGLRLVLVGDGPMRPELENLAQGAGLAGRVIFTGQLPSSAPVLSGTQIYVQPSRWDPVPRAMLEAMALGIPVVAGAVTGIPEVIRDGENGLLLKTSSSRELSGHLERLIADPELRQRLGKAASRSVRDLYTMEKIAGRILERLGGFLKEELS